ncbi:MAG: hypothetical protein LPD71_13040 [Shewanella sp.]|nr:hypothetical protein [Shewanella sp.]
MVQLKLLSGNITITKMKKFIVKPELIAALSTHYLPRIVPLNSSQCKGMIYQGIVYRADGGYDGLGMLHFFTKGFRQRPGVKDLTFSGLRGDEYNGHTHNVGISTTTSFESAALYSLVPGQNGNDIYIIDLSRHEFALDIKHSSRVYNLSFNSALQEVNAANSIHADMIYGHYCINTYTLTLNPNYDYVDGLIDEDITQCGIIPKPALIHPYQKKKMEIKDGKLEFPL